MTAITSEANEKIVDTIGLITRIVVAAASVANFTKPRELTISKELEKREKATLLIHADSNSELTLNTIL